MKKQAFIPIVLLIAVALTFGFIYSKHIVKLKETLQQDEIKFNQTVKKHPEQQAGLNHQLINTSAEKHSSILSNKNFHFSNQKKGIIVPERAMTSMVVTPELSQSIVLGSTRIDIPENSLTSAKSISITGLIDTDLPPIPAEIANVTDNNTGYRFLPHGMLFSKPVSVRMAYNEGLIPEGFSADDIYTYYFDEKEQQWKALERDSVDKVNKVIVSSTLHFTDMINGIIKVPESPETGGYTPTTLKNIKAADPMSGITQIAPPTANNEGDANISFPFKLPTGRVGMQPRLDLQYSLNGGSSWTGFGWDIRIQSIAVDILWGVPRYLVDKESETYVFSGSQLTPVAHRSAYVPRTDEKRFYQRIEGDFSKIIRHGNSPKNYWWEVTSKDGKRNFYGGTPENGLSATAVSVDANGNIGNWALVETRDVHGNTVSYSYEKPERCGQKLYISSITYTGKGSESGPYKITFLRSDDGNSYSRKDSSVNARFGYIERDKELLKKINITFKDTVIRSYKLWYKEGAFNKTLLDSIAELDAEGKIFYSHRFDYYDDVQYSKGYVPYGTSLNYTPEDDGINNSFLNPMNEFQDNISALGGSGSKGFGGGVSVTVGLMDGQSWKKDMTAGGNASYNGSKGYGLISVTDMNGDGLPDKVFKKDGKIYYRPNVQDATKIYGEPIEIKGLDNFSLSTTNGFSTGPEGNPPYIFVGYSYSKSYTKTNIYFADFNGDGLVDLANNGTVYFNHINSEGNPEFTTSSAQTPNPINAQSQIDVSILPDIAAEQAELARNNPLHDAVRMWRAPYTGWIKLNAPVQLLPDNNPETQDDTLKDGVKVSIQYRANVLWSTSIEADDFTPKQPAMDSLYVEKNKSIYFRVQSRFNGNGDVVKWDPEITYSRFTGKDSLLKTNWADINNKKIAHYSASEDFVLCGNQTIGMPKTGKVRLKAAFSKPFTTDVLHYKIIWQDSSRHASVVFSKKYGISPITNDSINLEIPVEELGNLSVKVFTPTYIDWSQVKCSIYLEYISVTDGSSLYNTKGEPLFTFKAVPEFTNMYNAPILHANPVIADAGFMKRFASGATDNLPHAVKLIPDISFGNPLLPNDSLLLSIKNKQKIFCQQKYKMLDSAKVTLLPNDTLSVTVQLGDTLYLEYYSQNFESASKATKATVRFVANAKDSAYKASLYSSIYYKDECFGKLYRGWGQFDYLGDTLYRDLPLIEDQLKINESGNSNVASMSDSADLQGINNPIGDVFSIMAPYANNGNYMGSDGMVYVTADKISSSRRGEKNVFVSPYVLSGGGLTSLPKENIESSHSVSAGITPTGYVGSMSWGKSKTSCDMVDMNADGFPDYLTSDKIQYTSVLGALEGSGIPHSMGDHNAKAYAYGYTKGGNYAVPNLNNTAIAKSIKSSLKIGDNSKSNSGAKTAEKSAKASVGTSGSFTKNDDETNSTWIDINGDGLPDKLNSNGDVMLNLGYSFAPAENWGFNSICKGASKDTSAGLGISIANNSFSAGASLSKTEGYFKDGLMDMNGDGLPDYVSKSDKTVRFNTGSGFSPAVSWSGINTIEANESVGESANTAFTVGVEIPFFGIKIDINPSMSVSHGASRAVAQVADFNFDGFPDFVSSTKENELVVIPSTINRTNMLRAVYRPLGSNFTLNYEQSPATYKHPGGKWVLDSVKVFDGLVGDGADNSLVTYSYSDGYYDRHERQFYGFETITTNFHNTQNNNAIYRSCVQKFDNSSYYKKGNLLSETILNSKGQKQTGFENNYTLLDIYSGSILDEKDALNDSMPVFVALSSTKQYIFEGADDAQISTRVTYEYDKYGNIANYSDFATGNEADLIKVAVNYHELTEKYICSVPKQQEVSTSSGVIRLRKTEVNSTGDIIRISQFINASDTANYDLSYDDYGNISKIIRPKNDNKERMFYAYTYDPVVHSFVSNITDAYGYSSSTSYSYKWGAPTETIDKNKEKVRYTYDDCGRVKTVTGPYEIASGKPYTILVNYFTNATVPYAQTLHYDSTQNADIETVTFVDGLGRPVQVKKTAVVFNGEGKDDSKGYAVSGKIIYDAFGREVAVYQPVFETSGSAGKYNAKQDDITPSTATYDELDRIIAVTLPDASVTKHAYGIAKFNNENTQVDTLTDALGHKTISYTDTKGKLLAEINKSGDGDIVTSYVYNPLGELLDVTDPKGNHTVLTYDLQGRRLSLNQPNAGLTEFTYDAAGNLTSKKTANLRKQIPDKGQIVYKYSFERLVEIDYPRNVQNKVEYSYGAPGAKFGRAGRITLIQDGSGGQEFYYGHLGEVVKTIRTVLLSENDMRTWIWSATYDTWNRMQTMTYPDGEKLTYSYNEAGNLKSMSGLKQGRTYSYISQLGYNKEEKQVYMRYGNGSVTNYTYDPLRQNLTELNISSKNQKLMSALYKYDVLSNVLSITNSTKPAGNIGGSISHIYTYDELNRLTNASGRYSGNKDTSSYLLSMKYDNMGNILNKSQNHFTNGKKQAATSYENDYIYNGKKPNAPGNIGGALYNYDENGNVTYIEDTVSAASRILSWDEENRLVMVSDDGFISNYTYDASGKRVVKSNGGSQGVYLNGIAVGVINHSDANYTAYVSPYFTMDAKKFTKHYYSGNSRIVSKIGNGKFENQFRSGIFEITAGSINYIKRNQQIEKGVEDYYATLDIPPGPPTMKGVNGDPYIKGAAIPNTITTNTEVPPGWPHKIVNPEEGGIPGAPVQRGDSVINETANAGFGYAGTGNEEETLCYFIHSDQLGSTHYVTNNTGDITQYIAYMPFGEVLVEKHSAYNNPYKFNAKELDSETGLYYYDTKYYDPKISLYYGVNPIPDNKYSLSPYIYSANNPIRYTDSSVILPFSKKIVQSINLLEKSRSKTLQGQVKTEWSIVDDPDVNTDTPDMDDDDDDDDDKDADNDNSKKAKNEKNVKKDNKTKDESGKKSKANKKKSGNANKKNASDFAKSQSKINLKDVGKKNKNMFEKNKPVKVTQKKDSENKTRKNKVKN